MDLGQHGDIDAAARGLQRRSHAGQASPYHQNIMTWHRLPTFSLHGTKRHATGNMAATQPLLLVAGCLFPS
jgi:hypothetical protein